MRSKFLLSCCLLASFAMAQDKPTPVLSEQEVTKMKLLATTSTLLQTQENDLAREKAQLRVDIQKFIMDIEKMHPGMTLNMADGTLKIKEAAIKLPPTTKPTSPYNLQPK